MLMNDAWLARWGNPCIPSVIASLVFGVAVTLLTPASRVSREEALAMITREREAQPDVRSLRAGKRSPAGGR